MKEDLLHYVWKMKRFDLQGLLTTMGNKVEIVDFGIQNHDAGPDFSNCRIRISDTLWIGNVEMHTKSSQWFAHGHQHDPNYQNVVLHVVYDDDRPVSNSAGQKLPTITLKDRVDQLVLDNYDRFDKSRAWIPCVKMISNVPDIIKATWLDRLVIERLERKTNAVDVLLKSTNYDWEESFFMAMCRNFGLKVNAYPFEVLASSISLKTLLRYKHSHIDIESLLFGQAGMLNDTFQDQYPNKMKTAYRTLRVKHSLDPINPDLWKFMRLRPANFPTIRLAQLAQLIYQTNHLFSKVLAARSIK
ncbi:MAG: DUF2851 family protein, partial [Bacteroidia bacterium]|nr:DUF2851 family protein [Bacteroidia bacterium]